MRTKTVCLLLVLLQTTSIALCQQCDNEDDTCDDPDFIDISIERPCPDMDLECIRKVFAERAECKPAKCEGNKISLNGLVTYLPSFNATAVDKENSIATYECATVTEFYINHNTDRAVLAVRFENITISGTALQIYHRPKKENKYTTFDNLVLKYPTFLTNTIFKSCLNLAESETSGFDMEFQSADLGDSFKDNKDADWKKVVNEVLCHRKRAAREAFQTRSSVFASFFIQNDICNFDLPVTRIGYTPLL